MALPATNWTEEPYVLPPIAEKSTLASGPTGSVLVVGSLNSTRTVAVVPVVMLQAPVEEDVEVAPT